MDVTTSKPLPAFGFLTAVEDLQHGFFGGYLVISDTGRPLEFHCSTPIRPNQAQRILYGPTLRPYLLGEVIGQALVNKAQIPVKTLLTDLEEMLSLALLVDYPVLWIEEANEKPQEGQADSLGHIPQISLEKYGIRGTSTCNWEPQSMKATLEQLFANIDLQEPFGRIRDAIAEAQRLSDTPAEMNHESEAA